MHSDDGIVLRLPDTTGEPPEADLAVLDPDDVEREVTAEVGGSALFASRFRECAARALLLPRRDPRKRTPLWQQRQRAAQLLSVASEFASFPITLEAAREVLQDVYDVPGLVELMRDVRSRKVRVVDVQTDTASPFAQSLLFGYVGQFLYEDDAPLAERRAQALALDTGLLAELLGRSELRELLDAEAMAEVESELQRLPAQRHPRDVDGASDLLRGVGDLTAAEAAARGVPGEWLTELVDSRRALVVRIAGEERHVAIEDAGRLRDALGTALPVGVPEVFTEPVADPLGDLVGRYARTHGPFQPPEAAARLGLGVAVVVATVQRLTAIGRLVTGEFRPGGSGQEWCDAEVLRSIRRRSLAKLRQEVEPVPIGTLARFTPSWQGVGGRMRGTDGVLAVVEQLAGALVPASALESLVLPTRVRDYSPAMLDELTSAGEVLWAGAGGLSGGDGWISLVPADLAPLLLPEALEVPAEGAPILEQLAGGQALFFRGLSDLVGATDDTAMADLVWDLVWAGVLTNDTLAPLRTRLGGGGTHRSKPAAPRARTGGTRYGRARLGRPAMPSRTGPPTVAGRWSRLPEREANSTRRTTARTEALLERHGVLTRGAVMAEQVVGGFSAVYPVLRAFEENNRARRGYFVETLGAAQFGTPGSIDRLRTFASPDRVPGGAVVLAATDPANVYGAALPWPDRPAAGDPDAIDVGEGTASSRKATGHRAGRKAGALVVLVDGELVLYVERPGRHRAGERRRRLLEDVLVLGPGQQRLPAALDVEDQLAVDQDHQRAGLPAGAVTGRLPARPGALADVDRLGVSGSGTVGPGQRGAVDVRRVRRRQHHRAARYPVRRGEGAQPVDRPGRAELGGPERLDEVAAPGPVVLLEGPQHRVDRREAADHLLGHDRAAGEHAVPFEQRLGPGGRPPGGVRLPLGQPRPAAGDRGRPGAGGHGRAAQPGAAVPRAARPHPRRRGLAAVRASTAQPGAERRQRVVGERPGPHEVPDQVGHRGVVGGADEVGEPAEEEGLPAGELLEDRTAPVGNLQRLGQQQGRQIGRDEADPAVAAGEPTRARPQHLTGARQLVEHRGGVVPHPCREHQRLQCAGGNECAGELLHDREDAVRPAHPSADPLPGRREPRQRADRDRLDLLAQLRQAAPPDRAEHLGVAPLLAAAAGPELAGDQPPGGGEALDRRGDDRDAQAQPGGRLGGLERAVGARVPADEVAERIGDRLGEDLRDPDRQCGAERVPQPAGVLDGDVALLAGDAHHQGPPGVDELGQPLLPGRRARPPRPPSGHRRRAAGPTAPSTSRGCRWAGSRCSSASTSAIASASSSSRSSERPSSSASRPVSSARACARRSASGRVVLVEELADVAEQQRLGERRGGVRLHVDDADLPRAHVAHQLDESGDVVDVLEHLPGGLEGDGEGGELAGHRQQLGRPLPLLPQGGALARVAAGEQQGPCGALAEPAGEQRRAADLSGHLPLDVVGVEDGEVGLGGLAGGVGQPQHDAVVGVHGGDVHAVALAQPGAEDERPGRVDLRSERGVDDQPPVAELVTEPLDQQGAVVGEVAGSRLLLDEVGLQVGRAPLVETRRPGPVPARPPAWPSRPRGGTRRAPGRAPAAGRGRRPSRTASSPAARVRG